MSEMGKLGAWLLGIILGGSYAFSASSATAQITPDRTLPNNSSVTINGSVFNITGGTQAGRNLFHSFQQFSVPTGGTASFNNGLDIQNIISRVTGGEVSNIDGLIRASGTANLFLINPNRIVFGKNASLSIGGSFVASTANSIKFADGFEYSAIAPQTTPLLTISVPNGLQFGANPGGIQVTGDGQGIRTTSNLIDTTTTTGLRVQPNQTLALVGGDINLEGATLKTAGGRIELGSVAGNGLVSLTAIDKGFSLGYGEVQNFGNIQLSKQTAVDANGEGGGDIQIWGRNITLQNLGTGTAGNLFVNARSLHLDNGTLIANTSSNKRELNQQQATITIHSGDLILSRSSNITTNATGTNVIGGNININTDVLAAVENSKISANSNDFRGGQVIIDTQGTFRSPESTITATGANPQLSGTLQIKTLDEVDPDPFKLVRLPVNLIESSKEIVVIQPPTQIVQACTANSKPVGRQSSFTIIGRGGLPASLKGVFSGEEAMVDLLDLPEHKNSDNTSSQNVFPSPLTYVAKSSFHSVEIVEAQGWVRNRDGTLTLVAEAPDMTPHNPALTPASCQTSDDQ